MNTHVPEHIGSAMTLMKEKGYSPYLVGGCVRDIIMKRVPHDFDITVDALPDDIIGLFSAQGFETVAKGHQFGTVGVYIGDELIEITPHRTESEYNDARHPDKVEFVKDIKLDLIRRDFTINAIAMDISGNIVDMFGGCDDIRDGIIRCIGDPQVRFGEDSLRILRAMRFASRFGFKIEENTGNAMIIKKDLISVISSERIWAELSETLSYSHSFKILSEFIDIIKSIIPSFVPHEFLKSNKGDPAAKLYSCICNESYESVSEICNKLKLRNDETDKLRNMQILYNDILTRDGSKVVFDDMTKKALCDHSADHVRSVFEFSDSRSDELSNFIDNGIYTNSRLAVSGGDIVSLGAFPKTMTSKILHSVLYQVSCGRIKNSKDAILHYLSELKEKPSE